MPKIKKHKPLPRWGGTKATGRVHERERGYKNRISQLERMLAEAQAKLIEAERSERPPMTAITSLLGISVREAMRIGIVEELHAIAVWCERREVAGGK